MEFIEAVCERAERKFSAASWAYGVDYIELERAYDWSEL